MSEARTSIVALRDSHDRIFAILENLDPDQLGKPSNCNEWTIAQVLSHLGSGGEIFQMIVDAGLGEGQAPGNEAFPPIWDAWNAKDPAQQAEDFKIVDTAFVERFESLDDKQLADFKIAMFGMDLDATTLLRMRLSELALHSWDIAVALDQDAKVFQAATDVLIDGVGQGAARAGKAVGGPMRVHVETSQPKRTFALVVDESVSLSLDPKGEAGDQPVLEIPSETLLRLVAGRMDPDHTPPTVKVNGVSLDSLRAIFPGF